MDKEGSQSVGDKTLISKMLQAHRVICPVRDKQVRINLPPDFPDAGEVEVIVLTLHPTEGADSVMATQDWLRDVWACAPDFPDCQSEDREKK